MTRKRVVPALLAIALLPGASLPPVVAAEAGSGVATLLPQEADAMVLRIIPEVERLRGLKFLRPVPVRVVDDSEARSHFDARVIRFWPESQMRAEQSAYVQLGLLPGGMDLKQTLFAVLEEQAGGYYDPGTDAFYMLGDMPRSSAPILMVHELTHALDDQHHGIDRLMEKTVTDQDRSSALGAVVEGSGTLVMTLYMLQQMRSGLFTPDALKEITESEAGRAEKLRSAPPIIQRGLLASYLLGQVFLLHGDMNRLNLGLSTQDLDLAFRHPPVSTEQILHPAKYWDAASKDLPRDVRPPDLCPSLGEGWISAGTGTLGELNLALMTGPPPADLLSPEAAQPGAWTNKAAAGWGGDQWRLCSRGEASLTILSTLWDTAGDAVEFETAVANPQGHLVLRHQDAVVLVAGGTPEQAERIARETLARLSPPGRSPG